MKGWHFAGDTLRDGRPLPRKGDVLTHDGPIVPCASGLHASERAIDAMQYAPGCKVAMVRLRGTIVPHGDPVDKHAASERVYLSDYVDVHKVLVEFAAIVAMDSCEKYSSSDDAMGCAMLAYLSTLTDVPIEELDAAWAASAASAAAGDAQSELLGDMLKRAIRRHK